MTKAVSVSLLFLSLAVSALAAPVTGSQSIKKNINTFVGQHFDSSTLCPLPSALQSCGTNPADLPFGSWPLTVSSWNHGRLPFDGNLQDEYLTLCLSDLQGFLASNHIDASTLADLKSWISALPANSEAVQEFGTWLDRFICNSSPAPGTDDDVSASRTDGISFSADIPATAVPEPSTISALVFGIGLLGGVLLRVRSSR
jgi:PEP-CTERM motif-containing protein